MITSTHASTASRSASPTEFPSATIYGCTGEKPCSPRHSTMISPNWPSYPPADARVLSTNNAGGSAAHHRAQVPRLPLSLRSIHNAINAGRINRFSHVVEC
uniref:Uncharacterized protein n=1 Tax=Mycobacterium leprae TaxID=1769 RepID=O33048_MYCLR|nr:hypothetical protein MLCB57.04c [Mycobacterium leprae]